MGRSHTIARAVTTTLSRTDSGIQATMDALAIAALNAFKAGGTYDLGIDRVWCQWDGTDLDVVLEDDGMAAPASDISARNTTVKNGLESLAEITTVNTANIETFEQSALAVTDDVIIGVSYAADDWPEDHFEDPTSLPTGWVVDTTGTTTPSYADVGAGKALQLVSNSAGKAMVAKTFSALTSATTWEMRVEAKAANLGTTLAELVIALRDGTKSIAFRPATTGLYYNSTSTMVAATKGVTLADGDWITYTIRRVDSVVLFYIGPQLVHLMAYSALTADTLIAGVVRLGNGTVGVRTATIRRFSLRTGSVNEAPPEYTMRGTTLGR